MFKKILNIALIIILLFCLYKLGVKQYNSYINKITYENQQKEYNSNKTKYLTEHDCDWITIPNTSIDYPIVWGKGDNYYLNHDAESKYNPGGSIFYAEYEKPLEGVNTTIYGHSMRDGSMFNNLHIFRKDEQRFKDSQLMLTTKNIETKVYKPLGVYITNDDFFYFDIDDMTTEEAVKLIQSKSIYDIEVEYTEDAHIITLMTCSYQSEGSRLFVFYISE